MSLRTWRARQGERAWRGLAVPVLKLSLLLAGALASWRLAVGPLLVLRFERRLQAARPVGEPSLAEFLARYPAKGASASARRLVELAAELGIDLASTGERKRARGAPRIPEDVLEEQKLFLERRRDRADDAWIPPGEIAARFAYEKRPALREIVDHLLTTPLPSWETSAETGFDTPLPSCLGILRLARVLVVEAHLAGREGHPDDAFRALDAADRLRASLSARSELVCHIIAGTIDGNVQTALRTILGLPPGAERLARSHDARRAHRTALRREAAAWYSERSSNLLGMSPVGRFLWAPYVRISTLDVAARLEQVRSEVDRVATCELTEAALSRAWSRKPESWNPGGRAAWPDLSAFSYRFLRRELDQELTALVLRCRRDPACVGRVPSAVCPDAAWIVTRDSGRRLRIELDRRLEEPSAAVILLPPRFIEEGEER